jgi:divalent metal cation (Fe/Co/Zn/Cd) transporter
VACLVIAYNGASMLRSSLAEALDAAPAPEIEERVRALAAGVAGVRAIEKCRIRKSGLGFFVELHVQVDGAVSVREGHRIAHMVKDALVAAQLGILDVVAHIEPSAR